MLTDRVAALVPDHVDLDEPRRRVVPLRPRADRDRVLEQRPRLGAATPAHRHRRPVRGKPSVHRRRRHHQQRRSQLIADIELTEPAQRRHQLTHHRRQPLARRRAEHRPAEPQRHHHIGPVGRRPRPTRTYHPGPQRLPQRLAGVIAMPARHRTQLVQDDALIRPARPPVAARDRLGHCLPLAHRQSHDQDLPAGRSPTRQARSTRASA